MIPKHVFKKLMENIKIRNRQNLNTLHQDQEAVIDLINIKLDSNRGDDGKKIKAPI